MANFVFTQVSGGLLNFFKRESGLAMGYGYNLMPTAIQLTIGTHVSATYARTEVPLHSASVAETITDSCVSFMSGIRMTASPIQLD